MNHTKPNYKPLSSQFWRKRNTRTNYESRERGGPEDRAIVLSKNGEDVRAVLSHHGQVANKRHSGWTGDIEYGPGRSVQVEDNNHNRYKTQEWNKNSVLY